MKAMVSCTRLFEFEACHRLEEYKGDCARLHGHSYKLEVTAGRMIDCVPISFAIGTTFPGAMVVDFKVLDKIVKDKVISIVDHQNLNDVFTEYSTTAEVMVCEIAEILINKMPGDVSLLKVVLWETSKSYATWERRSKE